MRGVINGPLHQSGFRDGMALQKQTKTKESKGFVSKRGRPSSAQVAAIDDVILTTARTMFLDKGFSETAMEAVAASAGVSKGTLYARYPDKQALFKAVAEERIAAWRALTPGEPISEGVPLPTRFFRRGVAVLRMLRTPEISAFMRLLDSEFDRLPELSRAFNVDGFKYLLHMLADDVRSTAKEASAPCVDPEGVADAFLSAVFGWYYLHRSDEHMTDDSCAAFVSRLTSLMVGGRSAW